MWAPRRRACFYCRPLVTHPMAYGLFVALDRPTLRHLATPPERLEHTPEMARMIPDAEFFVNQRGDPLQRPQLVGKARGHGSGQQELLELLALLSGQLCGPARCRLGSERSMPVCFPILNPAMDGSGRRSNQACDLPNPFSFLRHLHCTTTTLLQTRCGSYGSHVPYCHTVLLLTQNSITATNASATSSTTCPSSISLPSDLSRKTSPFRGCRFRPPPFVVRNR